MDIYMYSCLGMALAKLVLKNMIGAFVIMLSLVNCVLAQESAMCTGNHTLLEAPGDAVIAAFVDTNYGPYCNDSTMKGFQEVSTALYVVQTLNKYDYVPGLSLGLKIFDTCHDSMSVYKQALMEAVDYECLDYYELGILVPSIYSPILQPIGDYNILPVSTYEPANMTKALVDIVVEFISTKFEVIDLLLVDTHSVLGLLLDATRDAGICVKSVNEVAELDNDTDALIVVVAYKKNIVTWIDKHNYNFMGRKTWLILSLDDSYIDDIIPVGSYIIKSESFDFDLLQQFPSVDEFLSLSEEPVIHSPYLLSIGKSIIEIAELLAEMQRRMCPHGVTCVLPRFDTKTVRKISNTEVYEALHILPKSHTIKYIVSRRSDPDSEDLYHVASYDVNVENFRITTENLLPKMPKLCVKKGANKCRKCANFKMNFDSLTTASRDNSSPNDYLKSGVLIPIFLTIMACGTVASIVVVIFIVYRYFAEDVLDGNPTLTLILVLANIFLLQTVLPFCINDDYDAGREQINARKIYVSTLSIGIVFSVMLSRAFFLAFSTGGVFTSHINGYLQLLMVFFMAGVEVAISTMYFVLSTDDSARVVRSLIFIALLGYDIFLLIVLFGVCCFIAQIQRNYREGRCFFGTVIGLLIAWAVWLTCFALVEIEMRDTVVCSGIIATAYLIIIGILIPRTYYMVTHLSGGKDFLRRFETTDLGADPRTSTSARQSRRPFYDYVHPMESITGGTIPHLSRYPNFYGSSSPDPRYPIGGCGRGTISDHPRIATYNNYGYHPEMQEVENPYVVPRVCIENPEGCRSSMVRDQRGEVCYAQPRCTGGGQKMMFRDHKDCIETDVYVEGRNLSPGKRGHDEAYPSRCSSPRLYQTEETIREEDEDRDVTRITRL